MIVISRTEMLSAADRCDQSGRPHDADAWRRYAAECASGPALADRIIGRLSAAVIALTVIYSLLDPAEALLVAFGDAAARWLL
jgi:hypothetical protein